jgi:hypothetical protein
MDMHDITERINIHGQRKFVDPAVAVLIDKPGKEDLMQFGWPSVQGERGLTATMFRGTVDKVDDLTKALSRGDIVTER